jgi:hypothetical protein
LEEIDMRTVEWCFGEHISAETRVELQQSIERASSLDEVFDLWFLDRGMRFGLCLSSEQDGTINHDRVVLFIDDSDGNEMCSVDVFREDLLKLYPGLSSFDSFVIGWDVRKLNLELDEDKYSSWQHELGLSDSNALMCKIGPRRAAMSMMVSFALSGKGVAEAHHVNPGDYDDEDYKDDLDEEGINLNDYFHVFATYIPNPSNQHSMRTLFDPVFCRKAD